MNKFFFDDVREAPDDTWTVARDVPAAKAVLAAEYFDVWSLDHDIGMQMMCIQCYNEIPKPITTADLANSTALEDKLRLGCTHMEHGTDLARWALENIVRWPELIVIHSANPYGAKRMRDMLVEKTQVIGIRYDKETLRSIRWKGKE
jgi:hypothetical protein